MSSSTTFLNALWQLDEQLAAHGFPRISPWWKRTIKRFFSSDARRLVLRVGRRGGKSTNLAKVALAIALFGDWSVPPGDIAVVPFISVDRTEAAARLRGISAMLDALGVAYERRGDEIELRDRKVIFRVLTASVRGVVGITCVACFCDELARWRDAETNANPAREIISSLGPTMASVPSARMFLSSSPWSNVDYHATEFDRGDTDFQMVAHAATWEANPTITEAATHALEPDDRVWAREYAALPSDAVSSICGQDEYDACVSQGVQKRDPIAESRYAILVDPALRNDDFVIMAVHREIRDRGRDLFDDVIVVDAITILRPTWLKKVTLEEGSRAIARMAREYPGTIHSDIHYADAIGPALRERGLTFKEMPNTSSAISQRILNLQVRLSSGTIDLIDHGDMRKQVLGAQLILHSGGRMTLKAPERRGAHDDVVSALLLACDTEIAKRLPPVASDLVVQYLPVRWDAEMRNITGGGQRYFARGANGSLVPREPPYASVAFVHWANDLLAQGVSTPSIAKWQREQAQVSNSVSNNDKERSR